MSADHLEDTGFGTQSVHGGNHIDAGSGAIRQPIVMANSYALPEDPSQISWSGTDTPLYTRNSGANQLALQEKLALLEHGEDACVLATGVAALHAVAFSLLRPGDHAVISDTVYEATYRLYDELLPERSGITATFVDVADLDAVAAAIRPETKLLHTEAVANPTTKVSDIAALAEIAHARDALLVVDSTFTPPPLLRPLDLSADLVVHSLTKYINGHGDAMGGAVIGSTELIQPIKSDAMVDVGGVISPFNSWLIMRGSVTLPLRLRQQMATTEAVAKFLAEDGRLELVLHPSLPDHPEHELAARMLPQGAGGVLTFAHPGGAEAHNRLVAALRIITSAVSLGHDETLIAHVGTSGARVAHYPEAFQRLGHLRLSIGLEDAEDLIADLSRALDTVG